MATYSQFRFVVVTILVAAILLFTANLYAQIKVYEQNDKLLNYFERVEIEATNNNNN